MERWKIIIENALRELFKHRKDDLSVLIRITLQKQREEIKEELLRFSYFQELSEEVVDECTHISKIKYFNPQQTVYGDGVGLNSYVYFILSGTCSIIEDLHMLVSYDSFGNKKYTLHQDSEGDTSNFNMKKPKRPLSMHGSQKCAKNKSELKSSKVITRFLQVYCLNETACFGLGEMGSNRNRRIIAVNDVKCLLIPRFWLLAHNESNIWSRIPQFLKNRIPTTDDVFKAYVNEKTWAKQKENFVKSCLKQPSNRSITLVPYSIRINHDYDSE